MGPSKSQVSNIKTLITNPESGDSQIEDALDSLIIYLLEKFGPLGSQKIFELVSCFRSHGVVDSTSNIEKIVSAKLNSLMIDKHKVLYSTECGYWTINSGQNVDANSISVELKSIPKLSLRNTQDLQIPIEFRGVGNEFVYATYQSESRIESILRNQKNWLLKVGRTNNLKRRISQLSESGPNSLVIGAAFKTFNSRGMEKFIHDALHSQKKACEIPGRKEWFFSNLSEISNLRNEFEQKSLSIAS
jgi:hypothetical protein